MGAQRLARGDCVGDAGGRAQVVLEHLERAVAVAHDVKAGDGDPRADPLAGAVEQRLVVVGAVDCAGRHDALAHDPPLAVDVAYEQLERAHALRYACGQRAPLGGLDQPRDRIDAEVLHAVGGAEADATPAGLTGDLLAQLAQVESLQGSTEEPVVLGRVRPGDESLVVGPIAWVAGVEHVPGLGDVLAERRRIDGRRLARLADRRRRRGERTPVLQLRWRSPRHTPIVGRNGARVVRRASKMALRGLDPNSIAPEGSG